MTASLRERLGLPPEGLALFTCPTCGCHTAGAPPVACWACGALPRLSRRVSAGERLRWTFANVARVIFWTCSAGSMVGIRYADGRTTLVAT